MENFKIFIPKPCHENWQAMSLTSKGRFCESCSKAVVDFSDKTATEVTKLINERKDEKICGRFRNDQLTEKVKINIPINFIKKKLMPYQAFAVALLLVFGTTLFSCTTPNDEVVGEIAIIKPPAIEKPITTAQNFITTGLMSHTTPEVIDNNTTVKSLDKASIGTNFINDTVQLKTVDHTDKIFSCDPGIMTVGLISIGEVIENHVINDQVDSSVIMEANRPPEPEARVSIYPNPASGIINLKMEHLKPGNLKADIFDLRGSFIRNIIPFQSRPAETIDLKINLNDQLPGVYLLKITNGERNLSQRIVISR